MTTVRCWGTAPSSSSRESRGLKTDVLNVTHVSVTVSVRAVTSEAASCQSFVSLTATGSVNIVEQLYGDVCIIVR